MIVHWATPAIDDFTHICDHSEERFGAAQAHRFASTILDVTGSLCSFPSLGRVGRKPGTRELPIAGLPFVIVYRQRFDAVEIMRILHGAQQWP